MRNKTLQIVQNRAGSLIGEVVGLTPEGDYQVRIKGRVNPVVISQMTARRFAVGDTVTVCRYNGDNQTMSILGFGGWQAPEERS